VKYIYFMRDIPVRVVNALYEHHQIIEKARKNYAQSKRYNKKRGTFPKSEGYGKYFELQD